MELRYATTIDASGWERGIEEGRRAFDDFDSRISSAISKMEIAAPKVDASGFSKEEAAVQTSAADIAAAFLPVGAGIQRALKDATRPLQSFAATFGRQFEEVGATVEKLAIRIDDAMRFPVWLKRAEAFRRGVAKVTGAAALDSRRDFAQALGGEADASRLVGSFARARDSIKRAVAPIPGDVGFALEAAAHVDAKASFKSFLKGLDEVRSEAVDKMRQMAEDIANATGRGSRKARWAARDKAADLGAAQAAVPPRQNITAPTVPKADSLRDFARKAASILGESAKVAFNVGRTYTMAFGVVADGAIKAGISMAKFKSALSTLGSVADATFKRLKLPKFEGVGVVKGLGQIKGAANDAAASFKGLGKEILAALGVFGLVFKGVEFLKDGVVAAAGLNETLSKTDAVLGDASAGVKSFADDLASRFGLVKKDTLDVAAGFGGLFKGLGGQSGAALEKSTKDFTQMAADLKSFATLSMKDAGSALRTALSGNESDVLKGLGVVTDEATVKAYAYSHGIAKVGAELSNQEKLTARAGVITAGLKDAQGDLARTAGSTANQFAKFTGNVTNLGAMIGSALLPAVDSALAVFNKLAEWAQRAFAGAGDSLGAFVERITTGFDYVSAAIDNPKAAFEVMRLVALQALVNIGEYLDTLGPNVAIVATYIKENWLLLLGDAFEWTVNAIKNLGENFRAIGKAIGEFLADLTQGFHVDWTPLSKGFEATAAKFPGLIKPHLTSMSKEAAAAAQPIADAVQAKADRAKKAAEDAARSAAARAAHPEDAQASEKEVAKFAKDLAKSTKTPLEEYREQVGKIKEAFSADLIDEQTGLRGLFEAQQKLGPKEAKFAGAVESGSADARSAILAAIQGPARKSAADLAAEATADNTRRGNTLLDRIAVALDPAHQAQYVM